VLTEGVLTDGVLIRDTARRLARDAWIERRLFEVLGAWSTDCPEPEVARLLAEQSHHHAWHASLLEERQPVLHDLAADELAPPASVVALLDALAAPSGTIERLTGLVRVVVPELLAGYEEQLAMANPVADAPVTRVLLLVVADEQEDWRAAVGVLRRMLRTERDVMGAAAHQSQLDGLLLLTRRD